MAYTIRPDGNTSYKVFKDGVEVATLTSNQVYDAIREMGPQVVARQTFNHLLDAQRKLETIRNSANCSAGKVINVTEINRIIERT